MGLIRTLVVGTLFGAGINYLMKRSKGGSPAYAGAGQPENFSNVRNAGPEEMRDSPGKWNQVDEESDASFPASDPPANY